MIFRAIRTWFERRQALKELSALEKVDKDRSALRFKALLERIESAMDADQRGEALRLWNDIREQSFPEVGHSAKMFNIVLKLGLFDDAERLMKEGLARHPREQFYLIGQAHVAETRGNTECAIQRWKIVRKRFPQLALGYAHSAACLVKSSRLDEAEGMILQGIKRSRDDVFCLIQHARIAEARGNLEEAAIRWQHLRNVQNDYRHPCYQNGTIGLAQCLIVMGRFAEAENLLWNFNARLGVQEVTLMELAKIAEEQGDWTEAFNRWETVKTKFPMFLAGYTGMISVLKRTGREDGVETVLGEMMDRLPHEFGPVFDYAILAEGRGDKAEVVRRWLLVIERFPDFEDAYRRAAAALVALGRDDEASNMLASRRQLAG